MSENTGQEIEQHGEAATPMPIMQFEGEYITESEARMPAVTIELPEGYARGTILRLAVEARVKNIRYDENRKGDLVRVHVLALEAVGLSAAFRAEQRRDDVDGSASSAAVPTPEEAAALGVSFSRSADTWGRPDTAVDPEPIETPVESQDQQQDHQQDQQGQQDDEDEAPHVVGF